MNIKKSREGFFSFISPKMIFFVKETENENKKPSLKLLWLTLNNNLMFSFSSLLIVAHQVLLNKSFFINKIQKFALFFSLSFNVWSRSRIKRNVHFQWASSRGLCAVSVSFIWFFSRSLAVPWTIVARGMF